MFALIQIGTPTWSVQHGGSTREEGNEGARGTRGGPDGTPRLGRFRRGGPRPARLLLRSRERECVKLLLRRLLLVQRGYADVGITARDDERASERRTGSRPLTHGETEARPRARDSCPSSLAVVCEGGSRHPLPAQSNAVLGDSAPRPRRRGRSGDESRACDRLLAELSTGLPVSDTVERLILDLLEWIGADPRPYGEVLEAWRTSCPGLPCGKTPTTEASSRVIARRDAAHSSRCPPPGRNTCERTASRRRADGWQR